MTEEKPTKDKKPEATAEATMAETVQKLFKTKLSPMDFARGMSQMPELGAVLRHAGLQDARTMASVRLTSARMEAVRAKAVGDPKAEARAERAKAHAEFLAAAAKREEDRSKPVEAMLGELKALAGQFRLAGKVVDTSGRPVAHATVEIAGAKSGNSFKAETDENGVYDIRVPVGKEKAKADEGEDFLEKVLAEDGKKDTDLKGKIVAGAVKLRNVPLPVTRAFNIDHAAPIATTRPSSKQRLERRRSSKAKTGK